MSSMRPNTVSLIFDKIEPIFEMHGILWGGVSPKTLDRWRSGKNQMRASNAAQVAFSIGKEILPPRPGRAALFKSVCSGICEVVPDAPCYSWKTAEDFALWIRQLVEAPAADQNPGNPFGLRGAIRDPGQFFGRKNEMRRVRDYLNLKSCFQIVGPRRIGKSSILRRIEYSSGCNLPRRAVCYVDMQEIQNLEHFYQYVSGKWNWRKKAADHTEFSESLGEFIAEGHHPILCVDEFERFIRARESFKVEFFNNLRACAQKGLSIVTASARSIKELCQSAPEMSTLPNIFARLDLALFSAEEADEFVRTPRVGVAPFTENETAEILRFSGQHPLKLGISCYYVVEARLCNDPLSIAMGKARREVDDLLPSAP